MRLAIVSVLASAVGVFCVSGVTTFNDVRSSPRALRHFAKPLSQYTTQSGVACSGYKPTNSQGTNIYAAAMSDLSPLWTGSKVCNRQARRYNLAYPYTISALAQRTLQIGKCLLLFRLSVPNDEISVMERAAAPTALAHRALETPFAGSVSMLNVS
jgi:hypothetical protein